MLGVLSTVVALQCAAVLMMVSRVPRLSRSVAACVALFKTAHGYTLSKLLFSLLVIALSGTLIKMRAAHDAHLHYQHALASLLGSCLFLAIILYQLHTLINQEEPLKKTVKLLKQQLKTAETEKTRLKEKQAEFDSLENLVTELRNKMHELQITCDNKDKEINELMVKLENMRINVEIKTNELRAAEASVQALKKQGEGFLLEYDRLLEDNGNLRNQLAYFDRRYSSSDSKKKS